MLPTFHFPEGIHSFFSYEKKDSTVLSANEYAIVEKYGAKRMTDFCTGRYCLRQCTEKLGFTGDILIGERGKPLLPNHIAASISHSKTLCGAIAANTDSFVALGFDIETAGRVHKDMWHLLFTKNETEMLMAMDTEQQQLHTTIFFSMKEAFYKMQYPITGTYLDFPEVEIQMDNDQFYVKLLRNVDPQFTEGSLTKGSMAVHKEQVITWCTMPA